MSFKDTLNNIDTTNVVILSHFIVKEETNRLVWIVVIIGLINILYNLQSYKSQNIFNNTY